MNDINQQKVIAGIFGGFIAPILQFMYGPGDTAKAIMIALLFFIIMDWISGIRASKKDDSYASEYGIDGVFRSFFMVLLPVGGHFLDVIFYLPGFLFGLLAFGLLYHVIQSVTANCIRAGWAKWIPVYILNYITKWVKSELDSKISRAQQRVSQRIGE